MNYKLLLITQDNNLAKDILALNDNYSVKANEIKVNRINKYGFFSEFFWHDMNRSNSASQSSKKKEIELDEDETFRICNHVTGTADTKIKVSEMPTEGSNVYTSKESIRLTKELGTGGEAAVYLTNTPYVAKIYKKDNITARKYEKIQLMLSKNIDCEGICYPVEIIYNSKREFVGYLMPQAKGQELQKSVFGPKPLFLKKFPNWKKRDTVELCVTVLEKIKYLHDRNIIMGDINPSNILVVSPKEVYFVDTDSYQIEEYPCPVGTNNFTAPEIQKKHFSGFLRTKGNENFAVATLLFMIMLPGKPPYSQQGGEDPISNIIKMDFSYPCGDNSNKKTPEGPWRYIWSHLPRYLKEAFYNTFRKEGSYSL
jgi:DNA-binding helix-hairpin-helix protein with protein kinase domain